MRRPTRMPIHRTIQLWFVCCPKDDPQQDRSWQTSLHPHIYHECKTCGAAVHLESPATRTHLIRKAVGHYRRATESEALMDDMYAHPTRYFIKGEV